MQGCCCWPAADGCPHAHLQVSEKGGFIWLFYSDPTFPADERPPIPYAPELDMPGWRWVGAHTARQRVCTSVACLPLLPYMQLLACWQQQVVTRGALALPLPAAAGRCTVRWSLRRPTGRCLRTPSTWPTSTTCTPLATARSPGVCVPWVLGAFVAGVVVAAVPRGGGVACCRPSRGAAHIVNTPLGLCHHLQAGGHALCAGHLQCPGRLQHPQQAPQQDLGVDVHACGARDGQGAAAQHVNRGHHAGSGWGTWAAAAALMLPAMLPRNGSCALQCGAAACPAAELGVKLTVACPVLQVCA